MKIKKLPRMGQADISVCGRLMVIVYANIVAIIKAVEPLNDFILIHSLIIF